MRDILFRVWDGNRMTNKIRLEFAHGLRLISVDNLGFDMVGDDKCVLMQSTGLKDKNGVLIYEGDIVVVGGKYPKNKTPQIIGYDAGYLSYGIVYETGEMLRKITPLEIVKGIEIIGNIYENKELLTN